MTIENPTVSTSPRRESRSAPIPQLIAALLPVLVFALGARVLGPSGLWTTTLSVLAAAASLLAVAGAWYAAKRSRPGVQDTGGHGDVLNAVLPRIAEGLEEVADGNLEAHLDLDDAADVEAAGRVARAFSHLTTSLHDLIGTATEISRNVQDVSDSLAQSAAESTQAATDVANATSSVAEGAVTQAAAAEDVSRSVESIEQAVEGARNAVEELSRESEQTEEHAAAGRVQLGQVAEAMDDIVASFRDITATVTELDGRSEQVEEIVGLIRSIAEQTNLLALNAAIEAARAGDAGRGFAVVASEVKALAEESARSTEEISSLVTTMRGSVSAARTATDTGRERVDGGADIIAGATSAFGDIAGSVELINSQVKQLAGAASEIADSTDSIAAGVRSFVVVAEDNSAASEQVAASAEQTAATASEIGSTAQELAESARKLTTTLWKYMQGDHALDVDSAIAAHRAWKSRISGFLDGSVELHEEDVASERDCDLGQWLYSTGVEAYGEYAELQALINDHAALHQEIKAVITAHRAGDTERTSQAYQAVLSQSQAVIHDLEDLRQRF